MESERLTYRFGPLERRGLLGPVRTGQAVALALASGCGVAAIDVMPNLTGVLAGTLAMALTAIFVVVPIGGRTAEEWAPVLASFAVRGARGERRFRSGAPGLGMAWRTGRTSLLGPAPHPPDGLEGTRIEELEYRDRAVGFLAERRGRRLTAVLACRAVSFALLDADAQQRRLAHWGLVLSSAADCAVRRLQWIERTAPARADQLARWLHDARDPGTPLRGTPIVESYLELISGSAQVAQEHEILVALQVDAGKVRERGPDAVRQVLIEQSERLARGLEAAEVTVLGALGPGQIAHALRTAFDPYAGAEMAALDTVDGSRDGLAEANAWPLGAQELWDCYLCDGARHATYWIGGWPRVEVSPMFMDPLLGSSEVVRTVSVVFEPISPARSTREVEAAVTRDRADRELRHRFGQGETARQRQSQEAAARREHELSCGHAEVRLAGFVTVSGRDEDELRRGCAHVLENAARARLELHRMYGQQAAAFSFTLPFARGLR